MNSMNKQPGSGIEQNKSEDIVETLGSSEKKRKLKRTIAEIYEAGEIDPKTKEFTKDLLKKVKTFQWYEGLSGTEKEAWLKKVREIIVDKLELPYKNWLMAIDSRDDKKKKKQDLNEKTESANEVEYTPTEEEYEEIISRIENYVFVSD